MYHLADANIEIIIRDQDMRDAGEIMKVISWECTLKLNEMSIWQLEIPTRHFELYDIQIGKSGPKSGIMFKRNGELLLSGPVTDIKPVLQGGEKKTTMFGCCDLFWLSVRDCYPVITGPTMEADGNYYWTKKRGANGLYSTTTEVTAPPEAGVTSAQYKVGSVVGYAVGLEAWALNPDELIGTISFIDEVTNTLTITLNASFASELEQDCAIMQKCEPNNIIVDNPDFTGYDTRSGKAETVAKGLVYDNAAEGACVDGGGSRVTPNLHIAPDSGQGNFVTSNTRGENLLTQVTEVCGAGGVNFDVTQSGTNLLFDVYNGKDLTNNDELIFSVDRGNLKGYDYKYGFPAANFAMVYGAGMAAKKMVYPSFSAENIAQYGRVEGWVASTSSAAGATDDVIKANMIQAGDTFLGKAMQNATITAELWETEQVKYGRDFIVGDTVGVYVGEKKFPIPITAIHYTVPSNSGATGSAVSEALMKSESEAMRKQKKHEIEIAKLVRT